MSTSPHDIPFGTIVNHLNEGSVTAQVGPPDGSQLSEDQPRNSETVNIRVIFQRKRGRLYLYRLQLLSSDTGEEVMQKLRAMFNVEVSSFRILGGRQMLLWKPVLEIATISSFLALDLDLDAPESPLEVTISSRAPSTELTAAFYRPILLRSSGSFAQQGQDLLTTSASRRAFLVGQEVNKTFVLGVLCATLGISTAIGLVVGIVYKRAELGIAISTGVLGLVVAAQGLLLWLFKQ